MCRADDSPPRHGSAPHHGASRTRRIALGFLCTALLFVGYWSWLRSTRDKVTQTIGECRYVLDYPARVGIGESLEIFVYQDCVAGSVHQLAVESVLSSMDPPMTAVACPASSASCMLSFKAVAGEQAGAFYSVRLRVDERIVASAEIEADRFAPIRRIGAYGVPAISLIPLLVSLAISFHRGTERRMTQLLLRS